MWREREQSAYHNIMESCLSSASCSVSRSWKLEYPGRGQLALWLWCKYHNICTIPSLCLDGMANSYWAVFWMPLTWCCQNLSIVPANAFVACMISVHTLWICINQSLHIMSRERERERATRIVARCGARQRRARGRWVDGHRANYFIWWYFMWMWVTDAKTWIVSQFEEPNPSFFILQLKSGLTW